MSSVTVPKNSQHIFISFLSCFLLVEVFFGIQGEPFSYLAKSSRVSTTTRTRCRRWWRRRCWRRRGRSRRRRTCSTTSGQRLDRSIEFFCGKKYICFSGWSREKEKEGACDRRLNVSLVFLSSSISDF